MHMAVYEIAFAPDPQLNFKLHKCHRIFISHRYTSLIFHLQISHHVHQYYVQIQI